ncbi:MAG: FIG143263: Glycosyl transferase [uncultured Sulfurovum sp.]|uniref:FIG143263: Glycosyl transferase n=1 Tax=uncultured Sulfurovum sp. TaxID=269237 RepID=A0A6S6TCE6_9BACT|nr:MAG: FIG143263: Glycosyl transferase [uncultured Sulfurovum sp.]
MHQNKIIVIIPTYNNPKTIKAVVADVLAHGYEVIVVDDGSNTAIETLFSQEERMPIHFVRHAINEGKGQAIVSGTKKAKALGYSHVLSMDGDGQHLASEAKFLIDICEADEIIIGARNFDLEHVPFASKFGRWFSNMWACWDTGQSIKDSLSGYRIYPLSILDLPIKTTRFDWEMEVLVRHADAGKKIKEVEIECYYPLAEERVSHFKKFEDTMAIVWVHVQILPFKWLRAIKNLLSFSKK